MNRKARFIFLICIIFIGGCTPIYKSAELASRKKEHKVVAVLPFDVTIILRKFPKDVTIADVRKMEEFEAYKTQSLLYTQFLNKLEKYTIEFQDVDKTNSILSEFGISYAELRKIPKDEIANILGVDAVISGKISRDKPVSDIEALAGAFLFGAYGATNAVYVDLTIHDGVDAYLL